MQDNTNAFPQASQNQNPAQPQGDRGRRSGFRGRSGRGRGGLILCYWCRDFLPKEQANHKVANCPYQNQARDDWWKSQLGNGATLPTRFVPPLLKTSVEKPNRRRRKTAEENC